MVERCLTCRLTVQTYVHRYNRDCPTVAINGRLLDQQPANDGQRLLAGLLGLVGDATERIEHGVRVFAQVIGICRDGIYWT